MAYDKIEEPCFVCGVEDELKQARGSMSHPINCGWKIKRQLEGYEKGLNDILSLFDNVNTIGHDEFLKRIYTISLTSLMYNYNIKDQGEKRKCSSCGKIMSEGYCIDSGREYYCKDACLMSSYSVIGLDDLRIGKEGSDNYWTTWWTPLED